MSNIEDATKRIEAAERELAAAKDALAKAKAKPDLESIVSKLSAGTVFRTGPEYSGQSSTIRFFKLRDGRIVNAYGVEWVDAATFAKREASLGRSKVYIVKGDDGLYD